MATQLQLKKYVISHHVVDDDDSQWNDELERICKGDIMDCPKYYTIINTDELRETTTNPRRAYRFR